MTEVKTTTTVAQINKVDIVVIQNGEKRVAIKPICDAIGIDFSSQLQKIKSDPILGSTVGMITTVGADEKSREMQTIPFKYVFGWLFQIDSRKVKEEARETVLRYQLECYEVLYNYFSSYQEFVEYKQKQLDLKLDGLDIINRNFYEAKNLLKEAKDDINIFRKNYSYNDYRAEQMQTKMFSESEMVGGTENE